MRSLETSLMIFEDGGIGALEPCNAQSLFEKWFFSGIVQKGRMVAQNPPSIVCSLRS